MSPLSGPCSRSEARRVSKFLVSTEVLSFFFFLSMYSDLIYPEMSKSGGILVALIAFFFFFFFLSVDDLYQLLWTWCRTTFRALQICCEFCYTARVAAQCELCSGVGKQGLPVHLHIFFDTFLLALLSRQIEPFTKLAEFVSGNCLTKSPIESVF